MAGKFRTAPDPDQTGWPKGVPFIIGNEACERFSFYGMKANLFGYLATLYAATGLIKETADANATHDVHMFIAGVYAMPVIGAIIADKLLGKYLTIMSLSLVYCAGHGVLAMADGSLGLMHLGLALIAIGSGGIKPCVSANVGDQFGKSNWHLTKKVFQFFYMSINFGSLFSTLLTPWLLKRYGADVAFGVPGVLMAVATLVFWAGRYRFVHVPRRSTLKLGVLDTLVGAFLFLGFLGIWIFGGDFGFSVWTRAVVALLSVALGFTLFFYRQAIEADDGFLATVVSLLVRGAARTRQALGAEAIEGTHAVFRIVFVFLWVSLFWALFDQHSSTWLAQAAKMDLHLDWGIVAFDILAAQTSSANPALVLVLIPILLYGLFPFLERRGIKVTPLRRMTVGMLLAGLSFVGSALIERQINADPSARLPWEWQLIPYVIMTLGEVLVSATGLELAYTQAPKRMKSTIMSFWNFTVTIGNLLVALVALFGKLNMEDFFWFFAGLMAVAAILFGIIAYFYRYRDYAQGSQ